MKYWKLSQKKTKLKQKFFTDSEKSGKFSQDWDHGVNSHNFWVTADTSIVTER